MLSQADLEDEDDDDLFDTSGNNELSALRELEAHPGYALLLAEVRQRLTEQQNFLNTTDPEKTGLIGRHQGVIKTWESLLPHLDTAGDRADILAQMILERQYRIADRKKAKNATERR